MRNIVNIGIVGAGFGASFYFHLHPACRVEAVSACFEEERHYLGNTYKCRKQYASLEELLKDPAIDAVALFTPAPLHAEHTIAALNAGKHVLCAVPLGMSIEECQMVKQAVLRSGCLFMMAETSYYRQDTISARKFYQEGCFGKMIAAEADYLHPGLEDYFFNAAGEKTWRHGFPPMNYSTHCTSFLLGVIDEPLLSVSCLGWGDDDPVLKDNRYANPFWNETALFRSAGGVITAATVAEQYDQPEWWQTALLPEPLRIDSGHGGSHTYLTHEFIDAIVNNRKPRIGIEEAMTYTLPGILAHASAMRNGETLKIPAYGML